MDADDGCIEEHCCELELEVKAQERTIAGLEEDIEDLIEEKKEWQYKYYDLKNIVKNSGIEIVIPFENKEEVYESLVNYYYHEEFSVQEIFKRIGKKAVEVEFQKFLMTQD